MSDEKLDWRNVDLRAVICANSLKSADAMAEDASRAMCEEIDKYLGFDPIRSDLEAVCQLLDEAVEELAKISAALHRYEEHHKAENHGSRES